MIPKCIIILGTNSSCLLCILFIVFILRIHTVLYLFFAIPSIKIPTDINQVKVAIFRKSSPTSVYAAAAFVQQHPHKHHIPFHVDNHYIISSSSIRIIITILINIIIIIKNIIINIIIIISSSRLFSFILIYKAN